MNILITNPFHTDSLKELESKANLVHIKNHNELLAHLPTADALLIRSKTQIDSDLLAMAPQLKFIATATSGLDHINLKLCEQNKIEVYNPKEVNSISAAEHSFALLLSLAKNLNASTSALNNKQWKALLNRGTDLYGKTLGIVGLGNVGSKVAKIAHAFNMKLQAYDPYKSEDYFNEHKVSKVSDLKDLISTSNVISLHTPLTDETRSLLNESNLKLAQKNTILINTSRGPCINEADLIKLLKSKTIEAAGLDVFEQEPIPQNSELFELDNVLLSPHIGAFTEEAFENASFECTNWLDHKLFPTIV